MKIRHGILSLLAAFSLAGCASMNKEECLTADWRTVGFHDAAAGRTADTIDDHRQACAEYGVVPNLDRYLEGRKKGLVEYCRSSRGYQEGLAGRAYGGVCPANLEAAFKTGYEAGHRIYELEDAARDEERKLREKERRLKEARKKLEEARNAIVVSNDVTVRARAMTELQSRTRESNALEREIDVLKRRIDRLRQDARQARSGTDAQYR